MAFAEKFSKYAFKTFLALGLFIFLISFSSAAVSVTQCGVLNESNTEYILLNNLSSSAKCFEITGDNITIEGNGSVIVFGNDSIGNGIQADGVKNLVIKNLNLVAGGFGAGGIVLIHVESALMENVIIKTYLNNGYGVVAINSSGISVIESQIETRGVSAHGIYVPGDNLVIRNSLVSTYNTSAEAVKIEHGENAVIEGNSLRAFGEQSLALRLGNGKNFNIKNNILKSYRALYAAAYSNLRDSSLSGNMIYLYGSNLSGIYLANSQNLSLKDNIIRSVRADTWGLVISNSNLINVQNMQISMEGNNSFGITLLGNNSGIIFSDVVAIPSNASNVIDIIANQSNGTLYLINSSFNSTQIVSESVDVIKGWHLSILTKYNDGTNVEGARVVITDNNGSIVSDQNTSSSGFISFNIAEYLENISGEFYYSNYSLSVTKDGVVKNLLFNATDNNEFIFTFDKPAANPNGGSSGGGGGGSGSGTGGTVCTRSWECTDWSACLNSIQTRSCTFVSKNCFYSGTVTNVSEKPEEQRSCTVETPAVQNLSLLNITGEGNGDKGFFSTITGNVTGALKGKGVWLAIGIVLIIIIAYYAVSRGNEEDPAKPSKKKAVPNN